MESFFKMKNGSMFRLDLIVFCSAPSKKCMFAPGQDDEPVLTDWAVSVRYINGEDGGYRFSKKEFAVELCEAFENYAKNGPHYI